MKKPLAIGNSSFVMLRRSGSYYVDKTKFIKTLMTSGKDVDLIARPRRFGKSLFLDTLYAFLRLNPIGITSCHEDFQKELFEDLSVIEDKDFCKEYMGQFPVLFLNLKDVAGLNFNEAFCHLTDLLAISAQDHSYLLESPHLSSIEKQRFEEYLNLSFANTDANRIMASNFLKVILTCFARHFEKPAVLLIDEYDVPLAKATSGGYYDEMNLFMKSFLAVIKAEERLDVTGKPILCKVVLTGCLSSINESIQNGINKISFHTVCSSNDSLSTAIGFTESEVNGLLNNYDLESRMDEVKHRYDGYCFGSQQIFCPWNILNFCREALDSQDPQHFSLRNYWSGTSSNDVIDEFLGFLSDEDAEKMQTLLDGGEVEFEINEQLTYADFVEHKSNDFWMLLLFTGYLTVSQNLGSDRFLLKIPNEEIRQTFRERIQLHFSAANASFALHGLKLAEAALSGSADGMSEVLEPLLRNYVSVRDAASRAPAENYYHGFLAALFACARNRIQDFASNTECGDGYADIVFTSGTGSRRIGVVIEIKRTRRVEDLRNAVAEALDQVDRRNYSERFSKLRCSSYYSYGIAFGSKHCEVGGGVLRAAT